MPIILIIVLIVGGGASVAAQKSLPGSVLYGVKIHVNEEVRGWLAGSADAKADFEVRRAVRRLEEAETLTVKGKLDVDARAQVEANFQAFADRVNARLEDLKTRGEAQAAADLSANFETALNAHERILVRFGEDKPVERDHLAPLIAKVRAQANHISRVRLDAEAKVSGKTGPEAETAAQGKLTAAQNKIAEVRAFLENKKAALGAEVTAKAEAELSVAESTVAEGRAKLDAKAYGEAFMLFQKAHQMAQEAKLLVEVRMNLGVDMKIESGITAAPAEREQSVEIREKADVGAGVGGSGVKVEGSGSLQLNPSY